MIRALSIGFATVGLAALLLAAPAFAADGDQLPQVGDRAPQVTGLNGTAILAEFNDDVYHPYPLKIAEFNDDVYNPYPPFKA